MWPGFISPGASSFGDTHCHFFLTWLSDVRRTGDDYQNTISLVPARPQSGSAGRGVPNGRPVERTVRCPLVTFRNPFLERVSRFDARKPRRFEHGRGRRARRRDALCPASRDKEGAPHHPSLHRLTHLNTESYKMYSPSSARVFRADDSRSGCARCLPLSASNGAMIARAFRLNSA